MSPRTAPTAGSGNGVRLAGAALLVAIAAIGMMLLVNASPSAKPFDPRSGAGDGTRGLMLLLRQYGADVSIGREVPAAGAADRVLVLQDLLDDEQRSQLLAFADAGGVVVMADPSSPLGPPALAPPEPPSTEGDTASTDPLVSAASPVVPRGRCTIASLERLQALSTDRGMLRTEGDPSCFGDGDTAAVVAVPHGSGVVVSLADNRMLVNDRLDSFDHAGLATALLAPVAGERVAVVLGSGAPRTAADIGTGTKTLSDLVRPGVWMALVQLALAFVVLALAKGVRVGRPVREPEQVPVAGSELAAATGRLMRRAGHHERAAERLRWALHRDLCAHLRLPSSSPVDVVDRALVDRGLANEGDYVAVIVLVVDSPASLLDLSHRTHHLRATVLEGART